MLKDNRQLVTLMGNKHQTRGTLQINLTLGHSHVSWLQQMPQAPPVTDWIVRAAWPTLERQLDLGKAGIPPTCSATQRQRLSFLQGRRQRSCNAFMSTCPSQISGGNALHTKDCLTPRAQQLQCLQVPRASQEVKSQDRHLRQRHQFIQINPMPQGGTGIRRLPLTVPFGKLIAGTLMG